MSAKLEQRLELVELALAEQLDGGDMYYSRHSKRPYLTPKPWAGAGTRLLNSVRSRMARKEREGP